MSLVHQFIWKATLFIFVITIATASMITIFSANAQAVTFSSGCDYQPSGADWSMSIGFLSVEGCLDFAKRLVVMNSPQTTHLSGYPNCGQLMYCFAGSSAETTWQISLTGAEQTFWKFLSTTRFSNTSSSSAPPPMTLKYYCSSFDEPCGCVDIVSPSGGSTKCGAGESDYATITGPLTFLSWNPSAYGNTQFFYTIQPAP